MSFRDSVILSYKAKEAFLESLLYLALDPAYLKGLTGLDDNYLHPSFTQMLAEDHKSNEQHDLQGAHANQLVKLITFTQALKDTSHHSWHAFLEKSPLLSSTTIVVQLCRSSVFLVI